jgi:hypothetical protein
MMNEWIKLHDSLNKWLKASSRKQIKKTIGEGWVEQNTEDMGIKLNNLVGKRQGSGH